MKQRTSDDHAVSYEISADVEETSFADATPHPEDFDATYTPSYEVVKGGTKRGKDLLVDIPTRDIPSIRGKLSTRYSWNAQLKASTLDAICHWETVWRTYVGPS